MDFAIRLCLMFASKVLLTSLNRFVLSKSSPRIGGTSTSRSSSRMAGDDNYEEQGDRGPRRSSSRMAGADICEEQGDLFSAPSTTSLAHCVSSDLKMGAGIAVLFRKKFGRVENLKNQEKSVGEVAYLQDGPRFIFYLITKQWFYDKPTEATLLRSLLEMRDLCDQFGVRRLAMPRIGCGLDGLQWPVVYEMIIEVFSQCDMKVTIYTMPDRNSMTQKSMTPNFLRTQEKFRNFFEPKRPSSLPSSLMASKRKMYMHPSDDEYDTPKKRPKNSSFDDSRYQRNNSFSQPTSKISHHSSNFDTSDEDNYSYNRREKKATDSPWSKSFSSPHDVDKNDFWSTPQRYRGPIPYLSDGETKEESYTRDSKRSSYSISDYDKKEKSKVQDKYLSDEDEYSKPRDSAKKRMSQLQESPDYNCESKREMKRKDSSRSKERESRASTESDERKSRDSSRGKERKSRDSSRSKERKSRDSSRSKERKSRDSSRSKERKSKKTSRSKERKSRDSCEKKERKSRDSSRSKDKKSRDSSRSKDRKSKDSSRSKDRKSRDSSRSKERKHRDTSKRRVRESSESSEGAEREYGHSSKNQMSKFQLSDQSDNESIDNTSVTTRTEERYQRYEEHSPEGSMTVSVRKVLTSTQRGRQSNNVTEYSESHKEKKIVQKYPALNISLIKSALRGGMYSDREDTNGNSRKRNH